MNLDGAIDTQRVSRWWAERETLFAESELMLHEVTSVDSAGLAFLVKWAKAQLARGGRLRLQGGPRQLHRLLALYGVDELFELEATSISEMRIDATK
ncbi:MAG: STAS domain-containing protein [Aeromonadaceae bacterium]